MSGDVGRCDRCGGPTVPVFYGYPVMTPELEAALDAGELVLGGCDPTAGPAELCRSCPPAGP